MNNYIEKSTNTNNVSNTLKNNTQNSPSAINTYQANIKLMSQPDTVSFQSTEKTNKTDKDTHWHKLGVGIALITALVIGSDFLFNKGKHVKNLFKKFKSDSNSIKSKTSNTPIESPKIEPKVDKIKEQINTVDIEKLKRKTPIETKQYTSLEEAKLDCNQKITKGELKGGENYNSLLNQLEKNNYTDEKSYIEICTRSKNTDYTRKVLDTENHSLYEKVRITPTTSFNSIIKPEFSTPDFAGSYLIKTLADGRKVVGISVNTGRCDDDSRPIRTIINIISKDKEFTPLQKDLIEIISSRRQNKSESKSFTDILSIGILENNSSSKTVFDINEEILRSSIYTAKKQSKNIDQTFIQKAMNGETLKYDAP